MTSNADGVLTGNAADESAYRGWFLGHFLPGEDNPRTTTAVEVKWAVYGDNGEGRRQWSMNQTATSLVILVRGRFHLSFPGRSVVLAREGDYALWQPGVPHHWWPEGPTVVVTVRWPSRPGDSIDLAGEPNG